MSNAIDDLKNGTINSIIMDNKAAEEAAVQNSDAIKTINVALTVEQYGIAVKKGDEEMLKKVNDALKELEADGTIDMLLKQYELK